VRVVSNAGPLIHLARASHFGLLHTLFGRITIPPAVYEEVVVRGQSQDGSREVSQAKWIHRRRPRRGDLVTALGAFLGRGEAEAIALAVEQKADLLLIDEAQGRGRS
jgi:predicted nucleic acid-binding protein